MNDNERSKRGLVEAFSTVVVRSGYPGELQAFSDGIGHVLHGSSCGRPAGRLDTNMRTPNQYSHEDMEALGIEWAVPAVIGRENLDASARDSYHTRLLDVIEFARCAFIQVYGFGHGTSYGRPYAEWPAISKPITWGSEGARQQIRFRDALSVSQLMKFWVTISFPQSAPRFGKLPREDGSFVEGFEAALPVTFRLLDASNAPPALSLHPVADTLLQVTTVQHQAKELLGRLERLVNPNPEEDVAVAAEVRELRKCFGSTAEMIDVLRAVRQGIRTR